MTIADYSKFMLCDKFCIQWLLPCMDVLECVMKYKYIKQTTVPSTSFSIP